MKKFSNIENKVYYNYKNKKQTSGLKISSEAFFH